MDNSKVLIFVEGRYHKIRQRVTKLRDSTNILVVGWTSAEHEWLTGLGVMSQSYEEYEQLYKKDTFEEALSLLQVLSNARTIKGKTFEELLIYEGFSLWWAIREPLYYRLDEIVKRIKTVDAIIEKEKPTEIMFYGRGTLARNIIELLASRYGISVSYVGGTSLLHMSLRGFRESARKVLRPSRVVFFRVVVPALLNLFKVVGVAGRSRRVNARKIVVTSATVYRTNATDVMMGPIVKELTRRNYEVVGVVRRTRPYPTMISIFKESAPWNPYERYGGLRVLNRSRIAKKMLLRIWEDLKSDKAFCRQIRFGEQYLWKVIEDTIAGIFRGTLLRSVEHVEMWKNVIATEKPDAIVLEAEYSAFGIAAIIAARLAGLPSVGIQHGTICPRTLGYVVSIGEGDEHSITESTAHRPIPHVTAVYGDYARSVLTRFGRYPAKAVVPTGAPRYDTLIRARKETDSRKAREKFKLRKDNKVIVLATEGLQRKYGYPDHDRDLLDAVLDKIKTLHGMELVIKLHPIEDGELQKRMISEKGTPAIVTKDGTSELLAACDLLITKASTIAVEAMIFNKPVIIANFSQVPDIMPYVESGAALGVYDRRYFVDAIRAAIEDPDVRKTLAKKRVAFLASHLYRLDDGATARVVDVIEETLRKTEVDG